MPFLLQVMTMAWSDRIGEGGPTERCIRLVALCCFLKRVLCVLDAPSIISSSLTPKSLTWSLMTSLTRRVISSWIGG